MKDKIKKLSKIAILCLGMSLLLCNCEKADDAIDIAVDKAHTSNIDLEFIDYSTINKNTTLSQKVTSISDRFNSSKNTITGKTNSKTDDPSKLYDYTILTHQAIHISMENYDSYTFHLVREQPTHLIENLVLSENKDGSYDALIATYDLTEAQKQELLNKTISNLPNYTSLTKIEGFNANTLFSKVYNEGSYCYELKEEISKATGWNIIKQVIVDCPDSGGSGGNPESGSDSGSDDDGFGNGSTNDEEPSVGGGSSGNSTNEPGNIGVLTSPFISPSLIVIKDLGITDPLQIKFFNDNQGLAKQINEFILLNGHTQEVIDFNKKAIEFAFRVPEASDDSIRTFIKGQLELEKLHKRNTITLKPNNGKINNRDDQKYTHFGTDGVYGYYKMEDGSIVISSPTALSLNSDGKLVAYFTSETSNDHYWYIKPEGSTLWSNYLIKTNHTNLAHELEITAKLSLLALGKAIGTYILPIEDVKILITGTDFDGDQVSRYQAAGFLLLTIVPGSKALKIVGKASDALTVVVKLGSNNLVVDTAKAGLKVVTDSNVIKFLSNTGDEIARIVEGIMTFKYSGFGSNIITNPNKTTTLLGRYADNTGNGTKAVLDSKLFKFGENKGGFNLLDESTWSNLTQNQRDLLNHNWLEQAFQRGDDIRLVSDQTNKFSNGILTQYGKELNWIETFVNTYNYSYNSTTKTFIKN